MRMIAAVTALSLCACVTTRTITPTAYQPLELAAADLPWRLASVSVEPLKSPTPAASGAVSQQAMLDTITTHVRDALNSERALGRPVDNTTAAAYAMEVTIRLQENKRLNPWFGVGIASAATLPAAGALLGALGGPIGSLVGLATGAAAALPIVSNAPALSADGHLLADVLLRDPAGFEFARISERVEWVVASSRREELPAEIAKSSGEALPVLERKVATAVRAAIEARPRMVVSP
jgi:hypothetical protein